MSAAPTTRTPAAVRARLVALQRLYIRLLHCVDTAREYAEVPAHVLARYGLSPADRASLPDTTGARHLAEMHGRRLLCASELSTALPAALALLAGEQSSPREIAHAAWFQAFLASEHFYAPERSLPDAWGIGRGYEGVSRFFFWARDRVGDAAVLDALFRDFALWLVRSAADATHPSWSKLAKGSFWRRPGAEAGSFTVVSSAGTIIELSGDHTPSQLQALGLVDLCKLAPETIA